MKTHSEQAENSIFFQQLDICCQKIAEQVGEKYISEWTNGDYVRLSGLLSRKTKIQLSESTLKRIFGKAKTSQRYYPQKATRDALAQFIGYRDWYEFEFRNLVRPEQPIVVVKTAESIPEHEQEKTGAGWLMLAAFLGIAFILTIIVLIPGNKDDVITNIKLKCINPEGISPHSAIFKLEAPKSIPDSINRFAIEFGDGRAKRSYFTDSLLNHYYESPGRYYAQLFYKKKVIDTAYVYLQTKGWDVTGFNQFDTTRVYPVTAADMDKKQVIAISAQEALHAGVDTLHTFFIAFSNIKPSSISGDNFELSAQLNTSARRAGVRCSQVDINVYGEKDRHFFSIIKPECTVWTKYQFSENGKDGNNYDLRSFGHDLSHGGRLKFLVKNKMVSLFIDNKQVYKTNYHKPIGKIMGVNIMFSGIGSFQKFRLTDLSTGESF